MSRLLSLLAVSLLLAFCASAPSAATTQSTTPLTGVVSDAAGRPVVAAVVRAVAADGSALAETPTNVEGHWHLAIDPARVSAVEIAAPGFKTVRHAMGAVTSGETIRTALALAPLTEQVVVTAATDRAPLEVVMDAKQPRQPVPAHDGADYLKTIPGFATVRKGGSGGDAVFRGMAGSRLAILGDGATILGGCSARMDAPTAYIFPETFDLITVVKGPQTVKHGPMASAGTVLFERDRTHVLQPFWKANGSVTFGGWGRHDEVFDVRAGAPRAYVRVSGSRSASDDYRDGTGTAVHSAFMRWNADVAAGWTPTAMTRLEVSATASDGRAAYADRGVDGSLFRRTGTSVSFEHRRPASHLAAIDASVSYNYVDHIMDNYSLRLFTPSAMAMSPSSMNPDRTTYGGRVATTWQAAGVSIETGADYLANDHRNRSSMMQDITPVTTLPRVLDARFSSTGVFAEADYRPTIRTRLVGGLRMDAARGSDKRATVALSMMSTLPNPTAQLTRRDTLVSGFARVERQMASPVTFYAGLGHTQRVPDYWELVTKESAASLSAFETRPEHTTQLDAGAQLTRGRTSGHVSAYAGRVHDFILIESNYAKTSGMGMGASTRLSSITRNVDARTLGAEAGLSQRVGNRWTVDGTVAYARGNNLTDRRPLAQIPPFETRFTGQYQHERLSVAGLVRLAAAQHRIALNQGSIVGQDFQQTPGFTIVSANVGWRVATGLQLTAGVDNLLNTVYAEHISRQNAMVPGFALQTGQVREPGRMAWIRLSVTR